MEICSLHIISNKFYGIFLFPQSRQLLTKNRSIGWLIRLRFTEENLITSAALAFYSIMDKRAL